jgi:hypothetical protein
MNSATRLKSPSKPVSGSDVPDRFYRRAWNGNWFRKSAAGYIRLAEFDAEKLAAKISRSLDHSLCEVYGRHGRR